MSLPETGTDSLHYILKLPKEYTLCTPSRDLIIRNAVGELHIVIRSVTEGIEVIRKLQINKNNLAPKEDYPAFRELISIWNDPALKQLIISKRSF